METGQHKNIALEVQKRNVRRLSIEKRKSVQEVRVHLVGIIFHQMDVNENKKIQEHNRFRTDRTCLVT